MVWRKLGREGRQLAFLWGAAAIGTLLLRPVWRVVADWLPGCVFHGWTGIACPTCGTTRAALALMDGQILSAFARNPLAAATAGVFLAGGPVALTWAALGWPLPALDGRLPRGWKIAIVAVILANWVYLIAAGI